MRWISPIVLFVLLSACSSSPTKNLAPEVIFPQTNHQLFEPSKVKIQTYEDLITLTPMQVKDIEDFVSQDNIISLPKNKQVYEYLSQKLVNFNYEGENYSAREAMDNGGGNCMSLALLTYAVAKQIGVRAAFQVMHTAPMLLTVKADIAVTSDHVRTYLYEETERKVRSLFYFGKYVVMDYFPGRYDRAGQIIDEPQFIAMMYRNLAADALLANDLDLAYELLLSGVSYDKEYAPLINMMAIVHRRKGDEQTAEQLYQYGLDISESKISLLSNYYFLLSKQGNTAAASRIKEQLLQLEDTSPYDWYLIGQDALIEGDFESAEIYFSKFLKNTPYYHKAYFDLAKAQFALGKTSSATKSIQFALQYAQLPQSQQQYLAKLNWLNEQ